MELLSYGPDVEMLAPASLRVWVQQAHAAAAHLSVAKTTWPAPHRFSLKCAWVGYKHQPLPAHGPRAAQYGPPRAPGEIIYRAMLEGKIKGPLCSGPFIFPSS
ncbi:hypothetical protein [Hymenobacter nivis]|uniref:hypothetical protein n=1 Tax=Hymenobacter nivis TaxID=1850093 RepID=UPI0034DB1CFF